MRGAVLLGIGPLGAAALHHRRSVGRFMHSRQEHADRTSQRPGGRSDTRTPVSLRPPRKTAPPRAPTSRKRLAPRPVRSACRLARRPGTGGVTRGSRVPPSRGTQASNCGQRGPLGTPLRLERGRVCPNKCTCSAPMVPALPLRCSFSLSRREAPRPGLRPSAFRSVSVTVCLLQGTPEIRQYEQIRGFGWFCLDALSQSGIIRSQK